MTCAPTIACLSELVNGLSAARHFMTGVLIGAALSAAVFVLV